MGVRVSSNAIGIAAVILTVFYIPWIFLGVPRIVPKLNGRVMDLLSPDLPSATEPGGKKTSRRSGTRGCVVAAFDNLVYIALGLFPILVFLFFIVALTTQ